MKHLLTDLFKWRTRRLELSLERGWRSAVDEALELPLMLALSHKHSDLVLCCPYLPQSFEEELPQSVESVSPPPRESSSMLEDSNTMPKGSMEGDNIGDISCGTSSPSITPTKSAGIESQTMSDTLAQLNSRLRIENAELKKKLRFDAELFNKEIRQLRVENVELKKRLYFSSQYAPRVEESPMPVQPFWIPSGVLGAVGNQHGLSESTDSPLPGEKSGLLTPQTMCYAMPLPQGMVSPNGCQYPPGTQLIAVPVAAPVAFIAGSFDNMTGTTLSTFSSPSDCTSTSLSSYVVSESLTPIGQGIGEDIVDMQAQSHRDDRWASIPSGIVERCTSQFEGHEDSGLKCQVPAETGSIIPSGIVERFKSQFEAQDEVGTDQYSPNGDRGCSTSDQSLAESRLKEAAPFACGDVVEVRPNVLTPKYNWGDVVHGEPGIVTSIDGDGLLTIDFPSQQGWLADPADMQVCQSMQASNA
jgi:hypothetical protein